MAKSDIYSKVLAYMCENYNYDLYATDLNTKAISHIQHTFASVPDRQIHALKQELIAFRSEVENTFFKQLTLYV